MPWLFFFQQKRALHPLSDAAGDLQANKLDYEKAVRGRNERQPYYARRMWPWTKKGRFMGATCGARIRRRRQDLCMTQLDLAQQTGLSEAAVRSYELGTRIARQLPKRWACRPTTCGSTTDTTRARWSISSWRWRTRVPGVRPDRRHGPRDDGPGGPRGRHPGVGREGARLALRENRRGGAPQPEDLLQSRWRGQAHRKRRRQRSFDWSKAKMGPERMEENLAKLPSESDREAIRSVLENHRNL